MHIVSHAPQSAEQLVHVSLPLQMPSPQRAAHAPQSSEHVVQVSAPLHVPSPHRADAHAPQSAPHDEHVSVPLQVPSPHRADVPASLDAHAHASKPAPLALHDCAPIAPLAHTQACVAPGVQPPMGIDGPPHPSTRITTVAAHTTTRAAIRRPSHRLIDTSLSALASTLTLDAHHGQDY